MVNAATAQLVNNYRDYQAALTPEQLAKFGNLPDTSATSRMDQLRSAILSAPFQLNPLARDWDAAYDQARESTERTAGLISTELSAVAAAAAQRASNLAGINSVILMLGLLIGITIAVLVARSLIRSLRLLRSSALDVAERRLPQAVESMRAGEAPDVAVEPVPIGTRDEVGQVARAFDAVHGQAVRLAAEQAALQANVSAMFINLSRRSQALVERQLQLIEALESNEQDADQLSNLFQLDHLATRMRRNSENLLVLAGTDLAKRNMAPVPVVDVLRAAVSEVEQYQRVVVQAPPTASIAGRAGSDLVHLLAELLDNATAFSPPESQVVMSTTRSPDGAIVIEISDRGVGMADDELADANMRLVGPAGVDVSASRRMGLFVVGRLAARHGIGVRLSSTAAGPGLRAHGVGQRAAVAHPHRHAHRHPAARGSADACRHPGAGWSQRRGAAAASRRQRRPPELAVCAGHGARTRPERSAARTRRLSGGRWPEHPVRGQTAGQRHHRARAAHPQTGLVAAPRGPAAHRGAARRILRRQRPRRGWPLPRKAVRPASRPGSTRKPPPGATGWSGRQSLSAVPPLTDHPPQSRDDERSVSDDERSRSDEPTTTVRGSRRTSPIPASSPSTCWAPRAAGDPRRRVRGLPPRPHGLGRPPVGLPPRGTAPGRGPSGPAPSPDGRPTGAGRDGGSRPTAATSRRATRHGRPTPVQARHRAARQRQAPTSQPRPESRLAGQQQARRSRPRAADGRDTRTAATRRTAATGRRARRDRRPRRHASARRPPADRRPAAAASAAAAGALAGRQDATAGPGAPTDADQATGSGIPSGAARPGAGAPAERPVPGGAPDRPSGRAPPAAGPGATGGRGPGVPGPGLAGPGPRWRRCRCPGHRRPRPGPRLGRPRRGPIRGGPRPADTGPYAARAFTDVPGDDTDTPTTGVEHRSARRAASPGRRARPVRRRGRAAGPKPGSSAPTSRPAHRSSTGPRAAPAGSPPLCPLATRSPAPSRMPPPPPDPADELFAPRVPIARPGRPAAGPRSRTPARSTSAKPRRSSRRSRRPGSGPTDPCPSRGSPTPGRTPTVPPSDRAGRHRPERDRPSRRPHAVRRPCAARRLAPMVGART